jgi:hypothetical protein
MRQKYVHRVTHVEEWHQSLKGTHARNFIVRFSHFFGIIQ